MTYDCAGDVLEHKRKVKAIIAAIIDRLEERSNTHDDSKLRDPERGTFNHWHPQLTHVQFGTDEYKAALEGMGPGLQHHYRNNRHHPEHYENGVNGMTLVDLVEMVADWAAAAGANGTQVNLVYLSERFNVCPQLVDVIANTLREEEFPWTVSESTPA